MSLPVITVLLAHMREPPFWTSAAAWSRASYDAQIGSFWRPGAALPVGGLRRDTMTAVATQ